jgi:acyl carrier protein
MKPEDILIRVQSIIGRVAGPDRAPADAGPDTPLGEDGYWLDSLDVLQVLIACEEEFNVVFVEAALRGDSVLSARRLASAVLEQRKT